jgi:hypothetical protein
MRICRRTFGRFVLGGLAGRCFALPKRPKLLVLVVLNQLSGIYLENIRAQLAPGGLRRLLEKGAYFPDCRNLASTFPASSLATVATGAWPAQHGIVADAWFDASTGTRVEAVEELLCATTLAAQVTPEPRAQVHIVALEESQAALFAGTPDARVFSLDGEGRFVARGDAPDWLAGWEGQKAAQAARNVRWQAVGARSDAPELRTLMWSEGHDDEYMALYKASPFAQASQMDLAAELISRDKLGQSNAFDLVCILASSTELLGYETGMRSVLIEQMLLQLDRRLEGLFGQLAKTPGENNFAVVLTGAHGAPPEPPADLRDRMAVQGESVAQAVDRVLRTERMGRVRKYIYPFLYLDTTEFRDPAPIRRLAGRAALGHPAVAGYFTADGDSSAFEPWRRRFYNSFHAARSGDLMLSYQPEYIEEYGEQRGISYGSLYNYDARVPICLYGPQFRAGVYEREVELVDLAPTLARAMGVAPPSSCTGRVLAEALAE